MQTNLVNNLEKCLLLVYVFQSLYCCFFFKENFSSVVWIYARKVLFTLLGISLGEDYCLLTLSFVYSLRLSKLNEEMKESDYGAQGLTEFT